MSICFVFHFRPDFGPDSGRRVDSLVVDIYVRGRELLFRDLPAFDRSFSDRFDFQNIALVIWNSQSENRMTIINTFLHKLGLSEKSRDDEVNNHQMLNHVDTSSY